MNKLKLITVMLAVAALVQTGDACTVVIAGKESDSRRQCAELAYRLRSRLPYTGSPRTKNIPKDDGACLLWHLDA